ncbi:AlkA N-terminal domain-containing protein [Paraglaciecola aquimarina]|uniref:AlkA N-terminal domain-containing protein n=1 Tax=Paraglaciecola aquimarina TaxID=1235557 RepID=A0ABU3SUU7_9ALTE|nr:AlkA N-terminal domain-containing protein [Paraglaciecola aquimarina]MDU0353788.1 AlkA N-terminal domain-containing protein [Paraglaciecola aquimarina]
MNSLYQQARLTKDHRFDGKFFIAVKTTHIFCRPICPANSPLEKNVEYFQLAEQAILAGYRPCLRCRPDSAPQSYAWQGVNTTVNRAARLLRELPDKSIEQVAEKLGVSTRYFRQLFQQHLGMSPKQYQLFNKVLFAKQLLHQSQLSIEAIALASGFSCARRMQTQFKKITHFTPSQIRRRSNITVTKEIHMDLAFRPPYNWQHIQTFLQARAIAGIEAVTENSYSRRFQIDNCLGFFRVVFEPSKHQLKVTIQLEDLAYLKKVVSNIERIFDVKADTQHIRQQLIAAGINTLDITQGMRLPGVWNTFEAGCRAILGQQISVKAAINLLTQLCQNLAQKPDEELYFVTPQAVANSDLHFLKIPNSRKHTLIAFAQYMTEKPALAAKGLDKN